MSSEPGDGIDFRLRRRRHLEPAFRPALSPWMQRRFRRETPPENTSCVDERFMHTGAS
jgi:hypothetical protein